jgi:hypothetical protein
MKITKASHPQLIKIAKYAYPDYTGRKYYIDYKDTIDTSYNNGACGGGGTQYYYKFVRMDGKIMTVPEIGLGDNFRNHESIIPSGCACVVHHHFCGHDTGITIYIPKSTQITNQ